MLRHEENQNQNPNQVELDRRSFLRNGSFATFAALMGGIPLRAAEETATTPSTEGAAPPSTTAPPINFGVIGCGVRGRDILKTLATMPNAPIVAICDLYDPYVKRAQRMAPEAKACTDYKDLLQNPDVQGVVIATPTHLHRDLVLDALKARKHVYCEMPFAHTIEDARTIAQAAQAAHRVNFQAGLTYRADPQRHHVWKFIRQGSMGKTAMVRAQWHKKQSWRRTSPSSEQEYLLNWRLRKETSTGLIGEIGIHQLDMVGYYLDAKPVSVTGFGGLLFWNDGRDVPDTVQAVFEYPNKVRLFFDVTLCNSYDSEYEVYYGTDSAVLVRENRTWMFKEVDAPLLGWEVYARKDAFYKETGIVMMANATKLAAQTKESDEFPPTEAPLYKSLESFITNSGMHAAAVEDFVNIFGDNEQGLREYLPTALKSKLPVADAQIGFEATVIAIKANEAIMTGQKVTFKPEWFKI